MQQQDKPPSTIKRRILAWLGIERLIDRALSAAIERLRREELHRARRIVEREHQLRQIVNAPISPARKIEHLKDALSDPILPAVEPERESTTDAHPTPKSARQVAEEHRQITALKHTRHDLPAFDLDKYRRLHQREQGGQA